MISELPVFTIEFASVKVSKRRKNWKTLFLFCGTGNFYFLPRFVWYGKFCSRTTYKGDRYSKSVGSNGKKPRGTFRERLYPAGVDFVHHCPSGKLLGHGEVAFKFSVAPIDQSAAVGFYSAGGHCHRGVNS